MSRYIWYDQSATDSTSASSETPSPLFLALISADKGTEDFIRISGNDFYKMYGKKLSYTRHGQPLVQAGRIIDSGAELAVKRIVAENSTLGNLVITAVVEKVKVAADIDAGIPASSKAVIGYKVYSIENATSFNDVKEAVVSALNKEGSLTIDNEAGEFVVAIVTDNGRGDTGKRVKIAPDYTLSKNLGFMIYNIYDIENTENIDYARFTADPDIVYNQKNISLANNRTIQFNTGIIDGQYDLFVKAIADASGYTESAIKASDVLFGRTVKNKVLDNIQIDTDEAKYVNLQYEYGLKLQNGSYGTSEGVSAYTMVGTQVYETEGVKFFSGQHTQEIYDRDLHKFNIIADANYPDPVKVAIESFVNHREDLFFFRDFGLGLKNYDMIMDQASKEKSRSRFIADCIVSYEVEDAITKRNIPVTMMYSYAPLLANHFANGRRHLPPAGQLYGMIITEAIAGTVNFIPVETIEVDQITAIKDAKLNYCSALDTSGTLSIESIFTSQEEDTQLSFINNVMAIQEVIQAVRTACPKVRYQFQTGNDFKSFSNAVDAVLDNYRTNFASLEMVYTQDSEMAAQKLYNADIKFRFNNFDSDEIFNLYALPTE